MKLQTEVKDEKCKVGLSYKDKILLLGSCFTDNIGRALQNYGFDVCVNPFGTLYNPASILNSLERLHAGREFCEEDCVQMGSGSTKICSWSHHTSFARESREEFLENANKSLAEAVEFFKGCNKVIITLGTAWYFRLKQEEPWDVLNDRENFVVSNCLKRDAKEFERRMLRYDECCILLRRIFSACQTPDPGTNHPELGSGSVPKDIIFTVSPIRHLADGANGNQLSKSTLLLSADWAVKFIESFNRKNPFHADYFPAYEIMMDELRDYRFYAEDMVHPSAQAVNYIFERFINWALPEEERPILEANIKSYRQNLHISRSQQKK